MNSFRLHSNDVCSLKAGKRAAALKECCVSLNMRDLLSEHVDPAAEKHMVMPSKQNKELSVKRIQYRVPAAQHAVSKNRRYGERSPGSPARKHQHDRLQPIARQQESESFDDLRKTEEQYPRYSSFDTRDEEDIEDSLRAFQSQIAKVADTSDAASSCGTPPYLRSSSSFIREQEAIWSDFQPKRASNPIEEDATRFMIEEDEASPRNSTPVDVAPQPRPTARRRDGVVQQEIGGSRIKVFDQQDRVYAAVENGTATVLKCVGCSKHLLATNDVKLVFCPGCGTLSPVTLAKLLPSGEGKSGSF
jgi:hypothetical protein